jgi:hypothetical protein
MLWRLCAVFMLVLAVSPFTAPFQTCVTCSWPTDAAARTPVVAATDQATSDADDAGAVIGPVQTRHAHLLLALPAASAFFGTAIAERTAAAPEPGVVVPVPLRVPPAASAGTLRV